MKILVVEDDKLLAQTLVGVLNKYNYTVEVANDGRAGWELIETFDYDLIILDVILPLVDGISLCRQIRSQGRKMPILLLTGCDRIHDKAVGLDAGADDYLVKPFEVEELVARIRALLRRNASSLQPVLEWGQLRLEPISCEVSYGKQALSLTPKEYALLELFLRNSRRVFSCNAILEHLWSYEDTPGSEAVRTHIKGLRHKLKAVGAAHNFIETVYGIGYRLKPISNNSQETSNTQVNQQSTAQILGSIGVIWNRFHGRISEQVAVIEQACLSCHNHSLKAEQRENATREAHTLAGSLGTFGFPEGSKLAREIEQLFKSNNQLEDSEINKLEELVTRLRFHLDQNPPQQTDVNDNPLLLIVDTDTITQELERNAVDLGLRITVADNIQVARNKLYQEHPQIVLLDLNITPNHQDSFDLLAELKARKPPVPVIVLDTQTDFNSRLEIARHGASTFLPKNTPIEQVLETVKQVLLAEDNALSKILVVDDDPKTLALLQTLLPPWGLKVITLGNPHYFWDKLEKVQPDLLILDVEMPDISGIEICQVVRNDPKWSELPILFLTVHSDAETVNQVFASGADDFVTKPIIGPELVTRIINRLERVKLLPRIVLKKQSKANISEGKLENQIAELQNPLRDKQSLTLEAYRITQEALFAGIVSIADDAIITIDSNQCITLFNEGAENIFGYTASEVLGKPLDLLLPSRYTQAHRQHVQDFGKSPKKARRMGERREIYGCRKNGSEFPAEASISKLNVGNEIVYTVYLQDISERKQIERMKDEFVSVISHELRTPLTSIHGSLGMLASGLIEPDSEKGKRLLQIATDSTERLVRLINDILNIERIESGKVKLEKQTCNVEELISKAVGLMQPIAEKANITLSVSSISASIWVDPDLIIQTLTNLLSNAIKFSNPGSTVWLTVEIGQDIFNVDASPYILFKIKDNGRGIPADKLELIFERFLQVDSSDSRNHDGTGLGLAICRSIVAQHDGKIWALSTLESGSTFNVAIPHVVSESIKVENRDKEPENVVDNPQLVLIYEDDLKVVKELQQLLEKYQYHAVINSTNDKKTINNISAFTKGNNTRQFEQQVIQILEHITPIIAGDGNDETHSSS
jgi:PAS domain S-box-containing protein